MPKCDCVMSFVVKFDKIYCHVFTDIKIILVLSKLNVVLKSTRFGDLYDNFLINLNGDKEVDHGY